MTATATPLTTTTGTSTELRGRADRQGGDRDGSVERGLSQAVDRSSPCVAALTPGLPLVVDEAGASFTVRVGGCEPRRRGAPWVSSSSCSMDAAATDSEPRRAAAMNPGTGQATARAPMSRFIRRPTSERRMLGTRHHHEDHAGHRASWLRAGVLGANDGLLSTASLLVGVASASAGRPVLLATGVASLVAGAGSMAIGEYSSVSSQRDAERADLDVEAAELESEPRAELVELAAIYEKRGVPRPLAHEVAEALTAHDALTAHARDELGLDPDDLARPLEAAVTSAVSFSLGALAPLVVVMVTAAGLRVPAVVVSSIAGLGALGALAGHLGGASRLRPALRVLLGGAVAMGVAALVGQAFDVAVA